MQKIFRPTQPPNNHNWMSGIGKTTLARNLFNNAVVKEHFDIRTWTTISQTSVLEKHLEEFIFKQLGTRAIGMRMKNSVI